MLDREDIQGVAYIGACGLIPTETVEVDEPRFQVGWAMVDRIPIRQEKEEYRHYTSLCIPENDG